MPRPRPTLHRKHAFSLFVRISTAAVVTFQLYFVIHQTRLMSTTLYQDYSLLDASYLVHRGKSSSPFSSPFAQQQEQYRSNLPKWLADYFDWHIATRKKYPGDTILTDPNAPGVLVKTCAFKCGGLHDRLGGLGWDLYLANQTRRILMIHWCIPAPIEHYLVPNIVDWTLPWNSSVLDERLFSNTTEQHVHCDRAAGDWKGLFDGYVEYMQGEDFWEKNIDLALHRAMNDVEYSKHKILRFKVLGVDQRLQQRLLVRHNETDPISWSDSFPTLFWTLFKPSEGLQQELDETLRHLQISSPFDYSAPPFYAIHARIRHPRGHTNVEILSKIGDKGGPDKFGLSWDGTTKQFAIGIAEHALECAQKKHLEQHVVHAQNYVFYADSEDLVTHMGNEHGVDGVHVRNMTGVEVLHIDRQQQHPPRSYYSAFIDLFVAAQASCIVFGAGNYALLAAKINTRGARQCLIRHYPDGSHPLVLGADSSATPFVEFLDCNEKLDLTPTQLTRNSSDLPEYKPT
ncbi:hypothetical protein ACHAXR_004510 [Thalassiosira sp. AJA248-18]